MIDHVGSSSDRRLAVAEHLPVQLDAVALDVAGGVGFVALASVALASSAVRFLGGADQLADAAQARPDRQLVAVEPEQQQRLGRR